MSDSTLRLPFDQYQRYRLVADLLGRLRPAGRRLTVLDVGGRTALLRRFLPEDTVHLVDVDPSGESGLVLGDGSRLPFADGAVDAVVAFDTLEHVPTARREAFLDEALRVAGRWAIIAGPYDTEGVAHAEALLSEFLHGKMETRHRYLEEHAANGLPSLEGSTRRLEAGGARVAAVGHANLQRWLALMCAELYMDRDPQLRELAASYYEFYNASLYASDHAPPVYRHALVAAKGDAPLPDTAELLAPPVAPAGVFEPVAALLRQLVEFDVQRGVIKPEWDRLEGVNADLQLDLEGHRETLGLVRQEVAEQRKVIEEQRERLIDLVGHVDGLEAELEEQGAELEARAELLERERGEAAEVIEALRAELAAAGEERRRQEARAEELEAGLATVQAHEAELEASVHAALGDLARVREELAGAEQAIRILEASRSELEASLDDTRRELGATRAEADEATSALAGAREELAAAAEALAEQERAATERLDAARRELQVRIAELEIDLDATNRRLGETQAELDGARGERDSARAHGVELSAHLEEVRAEGEARLHAANVALGEKQGELDRALAELAALRATLADRRANLKRAFGRKPAPGSEGA